MVKDSPRSVIVARSLTKTFGSKQAVHGLSFVVNKGEIYGFLGPNGAGKTTTIRMLLSILKPNAGTVTLFGDDNLSTAAAHRRIGYLSGDMVLDPDLTGRQYLTFVSNRFGGDHMGRAEELAARLAAKLDTKIGTYSRGNKQKIGLIAAMMHQPDLLILDEPTSGFDPIIQEEFLKLIREYRRAGGTVFMSSHILSEVQELCDKVAFIRDGTIVAIKSLDELAVASRKSLRVLGPQATHLKLAGLAAVKGKDGMYTYQGDIKRLLQYLASKDVTDVTISEPELEEIFMDYYKPRGKK